MPLGGEFSGRRRVPAAGLALALIAVFVLASWLPSLARAAPRSHQASVRVGCANAAASAKGASAQTLRIAVVCLVNRERARYHLPALSSGRRLTTSAQGYTAEMVRRHFFSHTAPDGSTPGARIAAAGFRWSWYGENIATGLATPRSVVEAWMHSKGHCYNILSPMFRDIGVGVSPHPVGRATGAATWTADFGLSVGEQTQSGNWTPANSCPH
jgi:uncharacterized protein YkwD